MPSGIISAFFCSEFRYFDLEINIFALFCRFEHLRGGVDIWRDFSRKDVDEETLEKHPGWLPTSAKPGKDGVCVVYGHRNRNHLLILKEIEVGDEIDVVTSDGKVYTYVVEKTEILDTDTAMRIPTIEGKHMILMTCYPFYYTGHAPQKFVVTCFLKPY